MKLSVVFLLVLIGFSQNDPERIPWSESRKLTWDDFKARAQPGADYVASTSSGISFSLSYAEENGRSKVDYSVVSFFNPEKSWYKVDRVSAHILNHEQTHFNITELFARKLRKRLATHQFTINAKKEANILYQEIEQQRQEMQHKFDAETDHSRDIEKELYWESYIVKQLAAHDSWK